MSWEQLPEHTLMSGCLHVHRTVNQELQVLVCSVQMRCFSLLDKRNHDLKLRGRAMKFQSDTTRPHAPISPAGLWASGLLTRVVLKTWASPENVVSLTSSGLTVDGTLWVYYPTYLSTVMTPSCHSLVPYQDLPASLPMMENLPVYRSAWISSVARAAFSSLFRQVIQQIRQLRDKRSIGVKLCCWGWIRICRSPPNPPSSSSGFLLHRRSERKIREKLEKHSSLKREKGAHFPYSPLPEGGWSVYCWLSALVITLGLRGKSSAPHQAEDFPLLRMPMISNSCQAIALSSCLKQSDNVSTHHWSSPFLQ